MIKRSTAAGRTGATAIKVTFALPVSDVDVPVSVVGDFNAWDPYAHPLRKRSNGTRSVSVELPPGEYRFKYLTDGGAWLTEPDADQVGNDYAGTDSLIAV